MVRRSLFFVMGPWTPPIVNLQQHQHYAPQRIARVEDASGVDKRAYLQDILDASSTRAWTTGARVPDLRVRDVLFTTRLSSPGRAYRPPATDAVELLELRRTLRRACSSPRPCSNRPAFRAGNAICSIMSPAKPGGGRWHLATRSCSGITSPSAAARSSTSRNCREPYLPTRGRCGTSPILGALSHTATYPQLRVRRLGHPRLLQLVHGRRRRLPPTMPCIAPRNAAAGKGALRRAGRENGTGARRCRAAVCLDRERTRRLLKETGSTSVVWRVPEITACILSALPRLTTMSKSGHVVSGGGDQFRARAEGQYGWYRCCGGAAPWGRRRLPVVPRPLSPLPGLP